MSEEGKTNVRMFGRGGNYGERKQEKVTNRCKCLSHSHTYNLSAFTIGIILMFARWEGGWGDV